MFRIVLYEPEIPPNTGNIIRLCANAGASLHLVKPLGFDLAHGKLRRAGLDYHEFADVRQYDNFAAVAEALQPVRVLGFSTRGQRHYTDISYRAGEVLLFGPETRGLPDVLLEGLAPEHILRIPMHPGNRSLNLSNAVAVVVYEAWRQHGFRGAGV